MKTFTRTEALAEAVTKDPEGFAKWVEALRSGKYKQTQREMTVPGNEESCGCCLHILQIAHGLEGKLSLRFDSDGEPFSSGWPDQTRGQIETLGGFELGIDPVARVQTEAGCEQGTGFGSLNDKYKLNFDQIADIIEGKVVTL